MKRLFYLVLLCLILGMSFVLLNACKDDTEDCKYDDNGAGGVSQLPGYIQNCTSTWAATPPTDPASGKVFNYDAFVQSLTDSLASFGGMQYAVMQNGVLYLNNAQGKARETSECPEMDLTACNQMNIASVTKIFTAALTLRLLDDLGLDESATIGAYLPSSWGTPALTDALTFRQMLSHRSGFHPFTANNDFDNTLSYAGLKTLAENGPDPDVIGVQQYRNANLAMMRIIIPQLWKTLGNCPAELLNATEITDALSQKYYDLAMKQFIFGPVGADGELDANELGDFETLYYRDSNGDSGASAGNWLNKAGGGGWNMTARDMARVMDGIFNNTLLDSGIVQKMRDNSMGFWNFLPVDDGTLIGHGGDITFSNAEMHNLLVHHPSTNVSIAVNINTGTVEGGGLYLVVANAYNNAWE